MTSSAKDFRGFYDWNAVGTPSTENAIALNDVFEQTVDRVYSFLFYRCGSENLAEELVAETYLAASSKYADGRGEEVTCSWLLTVARRRLIDYWRRSSSRERGLALLMSGPRADGTVAELELVGQERQESVNLALASLSQRYRAALVLRYLEDFSVSEVAEALGLSYKATESTLSRARVAFAKAYEAHT